MQSSRRSGGNEARAVAIMTTHSCLAHGSVVEWLLPLCNGVDTGELGCGAFPFSPCMASRRQSDVLSEFLFSTVPADANAAMQLP
jgi:hypothetical protein